MVHTHFQDPNIWDFPPTLSVSAVTSPWPCLGVSFVPLVLTLQGPFDLPDTCSSLPHTSLSPCSLGTRGSSRALVRPHTLPGVRHHPPQWLLRLLSVLTTPRLSPASLWGPSSFCTPSREVSRSLGGCVGGGSELGAGTRLLRVRGCFWQSLG